MEFHPVANIFPLLQGDEYEALKADIAKNGLIEPVWLHPDGRILDGRNRWRACVDTNTNARTEAYKGDLSTTALIQFVVSLNLHRRHLNSGQCAMCAVKAKDLIEQLSAEARERQEATQLVGRGVQQQDLMVTQIIEEPLQSESPKNGKGETAQAVADIFGTNRQYVYDAENLTKTAPDLAGKVDAGKMTMSKAKKEVKARRRKEQIRQAVQSAQDSGTIKLIPGDALAIVPTLDNDSVALVITDPPYNVTNWSWDDIGSDADFLEFTRQWLEAIKPKLKADYHLFFFCDPDYAAPVEMLLRTNNWPLKSRIIWQYRNLVKGRDVKDKFIENWQMCFHCGTHPLNWPLEWNDSRFMVQNHAAPQSNFDDGKYHPAQKPLSLIKHLVQVGSKAGDTVLDLFAGGGTAGLACAEIKDRQCILIEQEATYCDVIRDRFGL